MQLDWPGWPHISPQRRNCARGCMSCHIRHIAAQIPMAARPSPDGLRLSNHQLLGAAAPRMQCGMSQAQTFWMVIERWPRLEKSGLRIQRIEGGTQQQGWRRRTEGVRAEGMHADGFGFLSGSGLLHWKRLADATGCDGFPGGPKVP